MAVFLRESEFFVSFALLFFARCLAPWEIGIEGEMELCMEYTVDSLRSRIDLYFMMLTRTNLWR